MASTLGNVVLLAATVLGFGWLISREGRLKEEAITEADTFDPSDPTVLEVALATGDTVADAGSTVYEDTTSFLGSLGETVRQVFTPQDLDTSTPPSYSSSDQEAIIAEIQDEAEASIAIAEAQAETYRVFEDEDSGWTEEGGLPSDYSGSL